VSLSQQVVHRGNVSIRFDRGESIWTDERNLFSVQYLQAAA